MESRCGILCGKCEWQKNGKCKGCVNIDNPFWGVCPVKSCCEGRGLEHCGECSEFPCTRLVEFAYDENRLLEINFQNARCTEDTNLNKYVNKKRSAGKVDMVVSTIIAVYLMQQAMLDNSELDWGIQVI